MADYVVEFTGRNNLSQAAQGVKKDLEGINNEAGKVGENVSKYDAFAARFEKITNSTKPMKAQLGSLKRLLADMNMEEAFDDKGLMTQVAERAGAIKDAIADANDAINRFSSDTHTLDAGLQAFQLGAAGASVLTGALGMLGVESDKTNQMILKVQSSIAILNGVQQIANTLNKDSALMQKIKAVQLAATKAAQDKLTASEVTGTIAEKAMDTATKATTVTKVAETAATKGGTIAQTAWNVAKAIGKAMLGDFTGLALLAVGAMTTYAMVTSLATDEEDEHNKELENSKESMKAYAETLAEKTGQLSGKYRELQESYANCRTEADKTQWIVDNRSEMEGLEIAVRNTTDADNIFVNQTDDVIKALQLRAKAAAYAAVAQKKLELAMQDIQNRFNAGEDIEYDDAVKELGKNWRQYTEDYQGTGLLGTGFLKATHHRLTEEGMAQILENTYDQIFQDTQFLRKKADDLNKEASTLLDQAGVKSTKPKVETGSVADLRQQKAQLQVQYDNTNDEKLKTQLASTIESLDRQIKKKSLNIKTTTNTKKTEKIVEGSLAWIQKKIQDLNKAIQNGSKEWNDATKSEFANLKQLEKQKKYELGLGFKPGSLADIQADITELENQLKNGLIADVDVAEAQKTLKELRDKEEKEKIRIGLVIEPEEGSLDAIKNKMAKLQAEINSGHYEIAVDLSDAQTQLSDLTKQKRELEFTLDPSKVEAINKQFQDIKLKPEVSSYDKAVGIEPPKTYGAMADQVKSQMSFNDALIKQLESLKEKYLEMGEAGKTGLANVEAALAGVNSEQERLGESAKAIDENIKKWEQTQATMNAAADIAGSTGSAFGAMGQAFSAAGEDEAAAVMNMVQTTMQGIAQILPQILALIGAKEGEAMASGTASAAALPYPANLAAIASVIATVVATFASIIATATQAFAEGGIVGGSASEHPILAHKGEMVLNEKQQKNLFNAIDKNRISNNGGVVGVVGRVRGKDIELVLENNKRSNQRAGINLKF